VVYCPIVWLQASRLMQHVNLWRPEDVDAYHAWGRSVRDPGWRCDDGMGLSIVDGSDA
jgi:hypothetical protein